MSKEILRVAMLLLLLLPVSTGAPAALDAEQVFRVVLHVPHGGVVPQVATTGAAVLRNGGHFSLLLLLARQGPI